MVGVGAWLYDNLRLNALYILCNENTSCFALGDGKIDCWIWMRCLEIMRIASETIT